MKPEVLAWALLFVIAVGVLYRFGAWMNRQRSRGPRQATEDAAPDIPSAIPTSAPRTADVVASRVPVTQVSPMTPAAPNAVAAPERVASAAGVREPPTAIVSPTPSPRLGAAAATALAARAQASQIRPDVKATLPPGAVARAAPTEQPTPAQPRPQLNEPRPDARAMLAIPSVTRSESPPRHEPLPAVTKRRSVMPRARKVGGKTPSFALRIKKSGTHKIAVVSEVTRKSRSAIAGKGRPRTTVRKALEKPAARRIGVRTENGNALASTKAATRIVGVPRHSSRIPISTTP
jgi:hypothetical protein